MCSVLGRLACRAQGKVNDEGYFYYPVKCSDAERRYKYTKYAEAILFLSGASASRNGHLMRVFAGLRRPQRGRSCVL
jgi:hypothetical protein